MTRRLGPYELQKVRNQIMSTLVTLQPHVDDIYQRAIQRQGKITHPASVKLLTNWLVSLTHILTGSRTRVEREVQTPRSQLNKKSRAILVVRDTCQLGRITMRDKQANKKGNVNYPTLVLFPVNLSAYWLLYLMFVTKNGAKYVIQYKYKLNTFLKEHGIVIDRSYEMRHMYLNNIGLQCDFDIAIMKHTSILVRHDLKTQQQHYTVWRRLYHTLDPKPTFEIVMMPQTTIDMIALQPTIRHVFSHMYLNNTLNSPPLFRQIQPIKSTFVDDRSQTTASKLDLVRRVRRSSVEHRIVGVDTSALCTAICFWKSKLDFNVLYRTVDGSKIDSQHTEGRWVARSTDLGYLEELVTEIRDFDPAVVVIEAPINTGPFGKTINQKQNEETNAMIKYLRRRFINVIQLRNGSAKAAYLSESPCTPNIIAEYPPLMKRFQRQTGSLAGVNPNVAGKTHPSHDILDAYLLCYLQAELMAYDS